MSVASFPPVLAAGGGGSSAKIFSLTSGGSFIYLEGEAGIYTFQAWSKTYGTSPNVDVDFFDSEGVSVGSGTLQDTDSDNSNNPKQLTLRATANFVQIFSRTNEETWISVLRNNEYAQGEIIITTTYSTSQSLTFDSATKFVLVGGGGNGGNGGNAQVNGQSGGGGGGGSGYLSSGQVDAGTYALIAGSSGGNSTFSDFSATGGGAGVAGGANGSPGSGITMPFWAPFGLAGVNGDAGGVYAGGGGSNGSMSNNVAGGDGGGGGGALSGSGRTGGAGGLIVLDGA